MKKKQRFYLMIESDEEIEPKEILFALCEARPNWSGMSVSLAAQQSVHPTIESRRVLPALKNIETSVQLLAKSV